MIKTSVLSPSPRDAAAIGHATSTGQGMGSSASAMAPLADLLDEFRHAMASSGELQSRRREQARRSVHPPSSESGTSESGTPQQASRARPTSLAGHPWPGTTALAAGASAAVTSRLPARREGTPSLPRGYPGGYPGATQGLPMARGVHAGRACGACVCPQVWEHASVEVLERLAGMPEVQDIVERLGARAAAGEISVGQAGSATADHLLKLAMPPPASGMSEPSCK